MTARRLAPGLLAALFLAVSGPADPARAAGGEAIGQAEDGTSSLDITFSLYVGGISFGTVAVSTIIDGDQYRAFSTIETEGIINRFWQSKIETAANGLIASRAIQPARYDSFTTRRAGQRREVTISFDPDGPVGIHADPAYNDDDDLPVTAAEARRSLDPLSALVFLTTSYETNKERPCGVVAPVYDGRRRYDVAFSFVRNTNVRMDNGIYSGPALECQIEYRHVTGDMQRIVEEGRMPRMSAWVAPVQSEVDPSRFYMLPLRLWADSDVGLVVAVASKVKLDGTEFGR